MKLQHSANFSTLWTARARLVLISVLLVAGAQMAWGQKSTTCHTCNPNYVPGSVVEFNMTLGQLSEISIARLSDSDGALMGNLYSYCMAFPGDIKGAKTLRKRVLAEMEKNLVNGKIDLYLLEAGCNPEEIGSARSPIAHLAVELPNVRTEHLEVIKKYLVEKGWDDLFPKMLNAKNTQGHTSLDYVQYMIENGRYVDSQKPVLNSFIQYLCQNGARYSVYKKSCDAL